MDISEFQQRASDLFEQLQDGLDRYQDDLDYEFGHAKLVIQALTKPDVYVVNTQQAAFQMWMAGQAKAWHFDWDEQREDWYDAKNKIGIHEALSTCLSQLCGKAITL
ncbi:MAG: iron donor protein CyaY [Acidobacteria bacterium]|nr:iron donor protein CyaY [Acidobacteriota bacterium]